MKYYTFRSTKRKQHRQIRSYYFAHKESHSHAKSKEVTEIRFGMLMQTGYCICPRCNCTFEREYQSYCDRCGQKLAWNQFNQNKVTLIKRIPCKVKKKEEIVQAKEEHEAIIL